MEDWDELISKVMPWATRDEVMIALASGGEPPATKTGLECWLARRDVLTEVLVRRWPERNI